MSVHLIVGLKCRLAASHAAPGDSVIHSEYADGIMGQTDGRTPDALCISLDAASVK